MTGWDSILHADEQPLWQGQHDSALELGLSEAKRLLFGLAFMAFAVFWMIGASRTGGLFWMVGLVHFCVGLWISIGKPVWRAYQRRYTWYTLTNHRAFIAVDLPFKARKLTSYPITPDTVLHFEDGPFASIRFPATQHVSRRRKRQTAPGFERLAEGQRVYRLMCDVQRAQRQQVQT